MQPDYDKLFRKTLKDALDTYHPGWDLRSYWKEHNPHNAYLSDTLNRWVDETNFPRKRAFADFLREAKFPKEVEQSLSDIFIKASQQRRRKKERKTDNSVDQTLAQQATSVNPNHLAAFLDEHDDEITTEDSERQQFLRLLAKKRFIWSLIALLILSGVCGFTILTYYKSQRTNSETLGSATATLSPQVTKYPNGWCRTIPIGVGLFNSDGTGVGTKPKLYFATKVEVGNFDQNKYYIYFLKEISQVDPTENDFVSAEYLNLVGFNTARNQWEFEINLEWIKIHPNWRTVSLWQVHYFCGN